MNLLQFFSYSEKARLHPEERHSLLLPLVNQSPSSSLQSVQAVQTRFVLKPQTPAAGETQMGHDTTSSTSYNLTAARSPLAGQTDLANKASTNTKLQVTA